MFRTTVMRASRLVNAKACLSAAAVVVAANFVSENYKSRSVVHCEEAKKPWALHIPEMPWAQRLPDEEYEAQSKLPVEEAILTSAPNVPPPITRRHPVLLKVNMTTEVKTVQLTSRYKYEAW